MQERVALADRPLRHITLVSNYYSLAPAVFCFLTCWMTCSRL